MVSLFNMFVTGIVDVPVLDPRLASHVDFSGVVSSDQGPAAPDEDSDEEQAPDDQASLPSD